MSHLNNQVKLKMKQEKNKDAEILQVKPNKPNKPYMGNGNLAAIRIRGMARVFEKTSHTLDMLRLRRKYACVVLKDTPSIRGMLKAAKDIITWGEIDDETLKLLVEKRGKKDPKEPSKLKPFFRLSPPRKGFERKGTKRAYEQGGALGYRGKNINDLLRRMV